MRGGEKLRLELGIFQWRRDLTRDPGCLACRADWLHRHIPGLSLYGRLATQASLSCCLSGHPLLLPSSRALTGGRAHMQMVGRGATGA